jgi:hypothetical protein
LQIVGHYSGHFPDISESGKAADDIEVLHEIENLRVEMSKRMNAVEIGRPLDLIPADVFIDDDIDITEVAADYEDIVVSVTNLYEKSDDEDAGQDFFVDPVTH